MDRSRTGVRRPGRARGGDLLDHRPRDGTLGTAQDQAGIGVDQIHPVLHGNGEQRHSQWRAAGIRTHDRDGTGVDRATSADQGGCPPPGGWAETEGQGRQRSAHVRWSRYRSGMSSFGSEPGPADVISALRSEALADPTFVGTDPGRRHPGRVAMIAVLLLGGGPMR